jgi:hypothetical protein
MEWRHDTQCNDIMQNNNNNENLTMTKNVIQQNDKQ